MVLEARVRVRTGHVSISGGADPMAAYLDRCICATTWNVEPAQEQGNCQPRMRQPSIISGISATHHNTRA